MQLIPLNTYSIKLKQQQLHAADLPFIKLCHDFILLLGFVLVILKQTQNGTFCCRLGVTTGIHLHMFHFQVLK